MTFFRSLYSRGLKWLYDFERWRATLEIYDVEGWRATLEKCSPRNFRGRRWRATCLALRLVKRFQQTGAPADLDEAIEFQQAVVALCPRSHLLLPFFLDNLCISLQLRFQQRSVSSDLDGIVEPRRAILTLRHFDHSRRSASLRNLANSLMHRFRQNGVLSDLDEAIELHRAALVLSPLSHSRQSKSLNLSGLAACLVDRFHEQGVLSDLSEAIELNRVALLQCPHSLRAFYLGTLAGNLVNRFQCQGVLLDLDEAIKLSRAAVLHCPPGHSDQPATLNSLALSLHIKFRQQGILSDLSEAIELQQTVLVLRPPGDHIRPWTLSQLANMFADRFQQQGVLSDMNQSIELCRAALMQCPYSLQPICLNNLASNLLNRFLHNGVLSDLDEVIEVGRSALVFCPPDHPHRYTSLRNLASGLIARFKWWGDHSDLDEAVELNRAALLLCPPGHPYRPPTLTLLAGSLHDKFAQWGILSDLDEAIELNRAALVLCTPSYPYWSLSLGYFARSLEDRFRQQGIFSDIDEAFELYSQLPQISHAVSHNDLHTAKSWAASAEHFKHHSVLVAYQTALKFLDQRIAVLSSSSYHFDVVKAAISSLAMDAFSCCVRHGALMTAVELVEQARTVFWTHSARFRTPLDKLSASSGTGAALAVEFNQVSFRLRNMFDTSSEVQSPQFRELTTQWEDVISRIHMLPDFTRFLLPPLFSDLQKAAEDGPVIIINASHYSCDTLIILDAQDPIHIPLDITRAEVFELSSEFQSLTGRAGSSDHQLELNDLVSALRKLWKGIVGPVVEALTKLISRGSRIWWCPTAEFALLPLHAAGPYAPNGRNLSQLYISSYTPTLAALIRARQQTSRNASIQHFVAIGQANPAQGEGLRTVTDELAIVARRVAPVLSFTSLAEGDATIQGALDALGQNQWLHLACHGMSNRKQPFESSFAMKDGPLTIKDIMRSRGQNAEFAFLSACHTTVGDESSPDEAIHLAAAMQFSGFRSVIGTMWSVDDDVVAHIVSAFYTNLVDGSGRLDCTRAAEALHKAVKSSRKKMSLEQQIVFIHIGV
jgi:CHAT domain-containing protein/tetratricopeptide (TPR) repeat protein